MNCSKCGEKIQEPAEIRCEKCTKEAQMKELRKAEKISPKHAVLAMLEGETIIGIQSGCWVGIKVRWSKNHFEATKDGKPYAVPDDFSGFRIVQQRPMNRFEILQWVQSPASKGWLVNKRFRDDTELQDNWQLPSRYEYDNYEGTQDDIYEYVRAPIVADGSHMDSSKMIGFFVEVL